MYIKNKPFIVDAGLSTYNIGKQRDSERSTKAHNTVEINGQNSSEVWGGFRVANRANIVELIEKEDLIKSTHDGYKKKFGILHTRKWIFKEDKIIIEDSLNKECNAIARLHFYPDIRESEIRERIILNSQFSILNYNAVVLAVAHEEFKKLNSQLSNINSKLVKFDIKSILDETDGRL